MIDSKEVVVEKEEENFSYIELFEKKKVITGILGGSPDSKYYITIKDSSNYLLNEIVYEGQERFFIPIDSLELNTDINTDKNTDKNSIKLIIYDQSKDLVHNSIIPLDNDNLLINIGNVKIDRLQYLSWNQILKDSCLYPFYILLLFMLLLKILHKKLAINAIENKKKKLLKKKKLELLKILKKKKQELNNDSNYIRY